ncbi:uncharacterized protein LOC112056389 [Bicyclus anynana]|uniref:Uncharacterized protein LOC112056389 n=1 Tax=Bicyclus anynana TaxID=110368 RepID=A0A6J1P4G2_BICAN|nr:uncharacterized protein LOC112056389 [Bicyclus anynana]
MKMTFGLIFLCIFIIGSSYARTDQEVKQTFVQEAVECSKEIPVSKDDIQKLKETHVAANKNVKCLVKCVFQRKGMIDDKGMFDESGSMKMSEKEYESDKDKMESVKKLYDICKKVNDEQISDDEDGCERAAALANCLSDNAVQLGFSIF